MTLLLIAVVIVAAVLIVSSLVGFTRPKKEDRKQSPYQTHMESLKLMISNGEDRYINGRLTGEFINIVHQLHVLTWGGAAIQRQSMAQRIRKHGYMAAINLRPIYYNKPRTGINSK